MQNIKPQTSRRAVSSTEKIIRPFAPVAALVLLASGLFSCAHKQGIAADSTPAGSSPQAAATVSTSPPAPATADTATAKPASSPRKIFKTGEAVPAGYLGYKVHGSWFTSDLSTDDKTKQSSAGNYLYVDLNVANTDRKERPLGSLKLIDEKGKEYPLSAKASMVEQSVTRIAKLEPSVSKRVFAIFEAPRGHDYKLKLQGFSAGEELLIELAPAAAPPEK